MSEPVVFIHGRIVPQSRASLTLHDAGFVMGATVTDLCRTFRRELYRWPEHLARFRRSCRATEIDVTPSDDEIGARAQEVCTHNAALLKPHEELALVMFATPGPVGYYLGEAGGLGDGPITFGMHTFPLLLARYRSWVTQGAALVVPSVRQVPGACLDPRIKMRSRLHYWLADREARRLEPGAAALLLDLDGHITETAAANVLIVQNGTLMSPPSGTILDGVSLGVVRELAAVQKIPYEERLLTLPDLLAADEALLCSTPYCLVGVRRVNGTSLPWPGPIFQALLSAWNRAVGLDIHAQILGAP